MKKLILARYGEWKNGHLSDRGVLIMQKAAQHIGKIIQNDSVVTLSADVSRAIESAQIITDYLGIARAQNCKELYAAEEEGIHPNVEMASKVIDKVGNEYSTVIAIVSREYIETLPGYISKNVFFKKEEPNFKLERGDILVIDYETQDLVLKQGN